MKRFSFRLDTLLQIRARAEETIKQELARKNNEIQKVQNTMAILYDELTGLQKDEKTRRFTSNDVTSLRYGVAYRHKLKADLLKEGQLIDNLRTEIMRIRSKLAAAAVKCRAIELMREQRLDEWKKEYRGEEQKSIDEISQQIFFRRDSSDSKTNDT